MQSRRLLAPVASAEMANFVQAALDFIAVLRSSWNISLEIENGFQERPETLRKRLTHTTK